eukprot:EG_transcript_6026
MTEEDFVAQDLLSQFGNEEVPLEADEESIGYSHTPTHDAIKDLASEIDQLKEFGLFVPETPTVTSSQPKLATYAHASLDRVAACAAASPEEALQRWTQMIQEEPGNSELYLERAKIHFKLGSFGDAVADGTLATQVDPSFHRGYAWTCSVLVKLGHLDRAAELAQQTRCATPCDLQHLQAQWELAQRQAEEGLHQGSVEALQEVVAHATHGVDLKRFFARECEAAGAWAALYRCLAEWLWQPPFNTDPYWPYMCAMAYYHCAMVSECQQLFTAVPEMEVAYPKATAWRQRCEYLQTVSGVVEVLLSKRNFDAALSRLAEAHGVCADVPHMAQLMNVWRVDVLITRGAAPALVIEECTAALEGNSLPWSAKPLAIRAQQYVLQQEVALAIEDYERLLVLQPHDTKAKRALARLRETIPDLYGILGVPHTASVKQLNAAYRRLVLNFHPDRQHGQTEEERFRTKVKFHELYETFMLLSDPTRRAEYDEFLELNTLAPAQSKAKPGKIRLLHVGALAVLAWGLWSWRSGRSPKPGRGSA